jgi:hypothetical protein
LIETIYETALAFTVPAAAEIEPQRDVSPLGKDFGLDFRAPGILRATEAVQHHHGGAAVAGFQFVRDVKHTGQL